MKKILSFIFMGAALLTIAACSDETETKVSYPPEITLSPSTVTLSSEAATCTINYIVSNAVDGVTISLSADASWVSGFDTSASGKAAFSVSANTADEMRTASLTLSYSYNDGTSTAKAAIVQYGINDPILSVDPEAVLASSEGGEYSFGYSIENPIEGETVECSTTATWVSGFTDADGTVSFTVAANDEDGLRTATIIVSYYGLEKEVDVVQEHEGVSEDLITITVDPNAFVVDTEGGDFSFTYTVEGVLDPTVTCTTEEDWITDIKDNAGTVSFTVAATTSHDLRTGFITVTCGEHSKEVEIVQDRLDDPSLSVKPNSITAAGEGETCEFTYTLKNPIEDERVTFKADVDWITNIVDNDATVTFTVAQNPNDTRIGVITVAYAGVEKAVTVTQYTDLSFFVGTYSCSGMAYNEDYDGDNEQGAETEWTMKIYDHGDGQLLLSGLVPDTVDYYPYGTEENGPYTAYATVNGSDICIAYPQWTGYYITSGSGFRQTNYYICWIHCPKYDDGFYYDTDSGTCTFSYDSATESWTSDTGLFLALNSSQTSVTQSSFYSYYDVFAPGMAFTKISDSTEDDSPTPPVDDDDTPPAPPEDDDDDTPPAPPEEDSVSITPTSLKSLDARPFHTGAKLAK